jgi:hypothetical protein
MIGMANAALGVRLLADAKIGANNPNAAADGALGERSKRYILTFSYRCYAYGAHTNQKAQLAAILANWALMSGSVHTA